MGTRDDAWDDLVDTHAAMRDGFDYTPDMDLYGRSEFWAVMDSSHRGDCEDFALSCRETLIDKGWDRENLRPACCWTETGGYHAVLVAEIDGDAYVLDNRQRTVRVWRDLPYRWEKILDKGGKFWVRIEEGR